MATSKAKQIQNPRDRYPRRLKKIPTPEFYVFYNGEEDYPESATLRLSDAFITAPEKPSLELVVSVTNINYNKGKFKTSYVSDNTWKLTCADKATREMMQLSKNDKCYFMVTLNEKGYITQIKSVIEGIREDIVHYTTQYLSPEDAEALGGAMGKLFVGNTLVAFFTDIEGKFLDKQTGNTLHFQLKTNPL